MARPIYGKFTAGDAGQWRIERLTAVRGDSLRAATRLTVSNDATAQSIGNTAWQLRGTTGHLRYTEQSEAATLAAVQEGLGRPRASRAALIPIRKSEAWWDLAQDQRRSIFAASSRHITIGLEYLPAIARRLYHCRELGEPFDFLTWFEFAPADAGRFEALLATLRASEEWRYVEREVHVRLRLVAPRP